MPIDLLNTYTPIDVSADLRLMHFEVTSGSSKGHTQKHLLRAYISNNPHPFMPDVYNLAFGPPLEGSETGIKDKDKIKHDDLDKMLSTLLFFAYAYLSEHPTHYIGIDGSCNYRAALYYRKLQGNYETLKDHFSLIAGNKYYIRFKRFDKPGDDLTEDEIIEILTNSIRENIDFRDIKGIPETIEPNIRITNIEDNYNYFTFKL